MINAVEVQNREILYVFYTDRYQYLPGEKLLLTLLTVNTTERNVVLEYPTSQYYDFAVKDGDEPVWRWSDGKMFLQVIQQKLLGPGEIISMREEWVVPYLSEGIYAVEAESREMPQTKLSVDIFIG